MSDRTPIICRSDAGDGGWSIYPAGTTDDEIASGEVLPLATGTSKKVRGQWLRPNSRDLADALNAT